jgi:outer membrane usher protein
MASKFTFTHKPKPSHSSSEASWQLGLEYLGKGFTRIANPIPDEAASLNLSSYIIIPLGYGFSSSLGAGYTFVWDSDAPNKYNLSGGINRTWFANLNSNLSVQYNRNQEGRTNMNVFFGLVWMFPDQNQSASLSMASGGNIGMQWDYNQSSSVPERAYAHVNANRSSMLDQYEAKAGYIGNRGIVEFSQDLYNPDRHDDKGIMNQSSITLQSALVYVDGNWAVSRPVSQGFVLVKGIKNLEGSTIAINPTETGYQAESSMYGPAVLPSLSPYNVKKIEVQPMDPPPGFFVEKPYFTLFPTYKCGYAIYIGSDSVVVVIGSLVAGANGEPFGHRSVEIVSLDDTKIEPLRTFTNSKGQFQLLGLKQGNYEIRPDETTGFGGVAFHIPAGTEGIYRIGALTLPRKP